MSIRIAIELLFLAAVWGGSFLFTRISSPELGPILLVVLRCGIAALVLMPIIVKQKLFAQLTSNWRKLTLMAAFNTAIPFVLFAYAMLSLSAGIGSVLNATAPFFAAIVSYFWLKEKTSKLGVLGLILGFAGVFVLIQDNLVIGEANLTLPTLAALGATTCYAIAANYTKVYMHNVKPLVLATGSQIYSALMLLPICIFFLPSEMPSRDAIWSTIVLAVACTGLAYIIFFRILSEAGPTKAISVTYLIPVFGILWGYLFLEEAITLNVLLGSGFILLGVSLTTGLIGKRRVKALS